MSCFYLHYSTSTALKFKILSISTKFTDCRVICFTGLVVILSNYHFQDIWIWNFDSSFSKALSSRELQMETQYSKLRRGKTNSYELQMANSRIWWTSLVLHWKVNTLIDRHTPFIFNWYWKRKDCHLDLHFNLNQLFFFFGILQNNNFSSLPTNTPNWFYI